MIHYYRYLFVKMKVFNYSELHFSEGTSFKIHTLLLLASLSSCHEGSAKLARIALQDLRKVQKCGGASKHYKVIA